MSKGGKEGIGPLGLNQNVGSKPIAFALTVCGQVIICHEMFKIFRYAMKNDHRYFSFGSCIYSFIHQYLQNHTFYRASLGYQGHEGK